MTKIGDIIPTDVPIPDDVLAVLDGAGDKARRKSPAAEWEASTRSYDNWSRYIGTEEDFRGWLYEPVTVTKVVESDALEIEMPTAPDDAVALIGAKTGRRWVRDTEEPLLWRWEGSRAGWGFAAILSREGKVRIEKAPPREPRTFPKLDQAPDDLRAFRGASGSVYRRRDAAFGVRFTREGDDVRRSLHGWQLLDGPLTEIIEEKEEHRG